MKLLEKAEEVVEGGFGRSNDGGGCFLPSSLPASRSLPVCWWHWDCPRCQEPGGSFTPWLSPLPAPLVTGQGPACTIPGGFQPLAQLHPTHPHTPHAHPAHQRQYPRWVDVRGGPASPSSHRILRALPGLGRGTGLPVPLGGVRRGVSRLGKRSFGEICRGRHWVGVLRVGSGCVALRRVALRCTVARGVALCWVVVRRVALRCVKLWCGV